MKRVLFYVLTLLTNLFILSGCSNIEMNDIKTSLENEGLTVELTDDVEELPQSTTFEINGKAKLKVFIMSSSDEAEQLKKQDLEKAEKEYTKEEKKQYAVYEENYIIIDNVLLRYSPPSDDDSQILEKIKNAASSKFNN